MKSIFAAAVALAALAAGAAYADGSTPVVKNANRQVLRLAHAPANRAFNVLYDQTAHPSTDVTTSQNFQSSEDDLDDQAADDFTVPAGQTWLVKEIDVAGKYSESSPADSVNVFIYFHAKGKPVQRILPGNIRKEFDNLPTGDDGNGNFAITLPSTVVLRPGTYFLSVQANMDADTEGRWYWENADQKEGLYRAVWRNPGNGWGFNCTDWTRNDQCTGNVDFVFALRGELQE